MPRDWGVRRGGPGMPLEFKDPDAEDEPRLRKRFAAYGEPNAPWWRPASTTGRVLFAGEFACGN